MASENQSSNGAPLAPSGNASAALLESRKRLQAECQALLSEYQHPRLLDSQIADIERLAAAIQEEAEAKLNALDRRKAALQHRRDNTRELYIEASERLEQINREIKLAANSRTIDRIEELKRQIAELEREENNVRRT